MMLNNNPSLTAKPEILQWNLIYYATVIILSFVLVTSALNKFFLPDQYLYLAKSFTKGQLSVDEMPLIYPDYVIHDGHVYLPPGPLPAVVLIPFLPLIMWGLHPQWINILFTILNVLLFSLVLNNIQINNRDIKWILLLFFGGTSYFSVSSIMVSWYFGHILTTTFLLLYILCTLEKKSPIVIGLSLGLAGAVRLSAVFSAPFFLWYFYKINRDDKSGEWGKKTGNLILFVIGLTIPLIFLALYNYARFENILETGYGLAVLGSHELEEARKHGLFALAHIPRNIYFLLFQGPSPYPSLDNPTYKFPYLQPSPLGMGIFFTTPALILILKMKVNDDLIRASGVASIAVLVPIVSYYATGWIQFGYRYGLDFLPFVIIIFARSISHPINGVTRGLILFSVFINLWGTAWLQSWL